MGSLGLQATCWLIAHQATAAQGWWAEISRSLPAEPRLGFAGAQHPFEGQGIIPTWFITVSVPGICCCTWTDGAGRGTETMMLKNTADTADWPLVLPHGGFSSAFSVPPSLRSHEQSHLFWASFPTPPPPVLRKHCKSKPSPCHLLHRFLVKEIIYHELSEAKDPSRL